VLTHNEYHTSIGDMSVNDLLLIVNKFDSIEFVENGFTDDDISKDTRMLMIFLQTQKPTNNAITADFLSFADHPNLNTRDHERLLWVFGCSHSHGTGLSNQFETYGSWLANSLGLPLKLITKPGSSTHWSLRQLINSHIKKNDYVVWQITSPYRLSHFNGKHVEEIALSHCKNRHIIETYSDPQCFFLQLSYLNIGIRYLRSIGVNFVVITVDSKNLSEINEYAKYPEFFSPTDFVVDYGSDKLHYGPLSHKRLALSLLNRIQLTNV
jgi:hypothetical protein